MQTIVRAAEESSFFELPDKPQEYKSLCPGGVWSHSETLDITWYAGVNEKHVTHHERCGGPALDRMLAFEELLFRLSGKPRQ
jgi:hypothetical protein